ncbi:MAG: AAA domain-containing protein [Chloroflexaceae bacterium]|nr:AAA domain-containing protein [Chloroflexaceae bacterium]
MSSSPAPLATFPATARAAFAAPGLAERWAAVQEHVHPWLAALAEAIEHTAAQHMPRAWLLYETSYKSQRYVNRGQGRRAPLDEYHVAFDRPPRGSGVVVSVSGAEQAVLVGLQLWGARKPHLGDVWRSSRALWQPLVERIATEGQARFTAPARSRTPADDVAPLWIDQYLDARGASYLWVGFVYPWENLPANLSEQLGADVLALLPLNEALMEQAEEHTSTGAALLREQRAGYSSATGTPDITTLVERVQGRGVALSATLIRAYHVALQTRPLVILPGISGTGKTRLTRLYADAVHGVSAEHNPYYLIVAVQPDWHNARDLLGYYNSLTGRYHPTPFLRFLLQAQSDPQQPYFVCLDEMNLARPEYYLAPILSALETPERSIDLGTPASEAQMVSGEGIRSPLRLPLNLYMTGTVNIDESTYPLSDKLLDRATVIELTQVDLAGFRASYPHPIDDTLWNVLTDVHALLTRAGQPFGYRALREMIQYVEQSAGVFPPQQALDLALKQRVLPRLRGEDTPRLREALSDLLTLLLGQPQRTWQRAALVDSSTLAAATYPESAAKMRRMLERLEQEGFTDFYG